MSKTTHVFDSSAVLCIYLGEPGSDRLNDLAKDALISSVNLSEVVSKLQERGVSDDDIDVVTDNFDMEVVPFDHAQAVAAGKLRRATRSRGLSLGDRACLALAAERRAVAVTTDKAWKDFENVARILLVR